MTTTSPARKIPDSLYISPDAMEVYLECFSGPLDLLLHLIRQKNLSISEVSIKKVTDQYLLYIENISHLKFELVAEYLLMAALLAEIKSKDLLPKNEDAPNEDDEAQRLLENLRQYEILTQATEKIDAIPRLGRDFFTVEIKRIKFTQPKTTAVEKLTNIEIQDLKKTFESLLIRKERFKEYQIEYDEISVSEKMTEIMDKLRMRVGEYISFQKLLNAKQGRMGLVVQFVCLLELTKTGSIDMRQFEDGLIYARANN